MIRNIVLALAIVVGFFLQRNPMLWGQTAGSLPDNATFPVYEEHAVLDAVLQHHESEKTGWTNRQSHRERTKQETDAGEGAKEFVYF